MNNQNNISSSILDTCFNCGEKRPEDDFFWLRDFICQKCNFNHYVNINDLLNDFFNENKNNELIINRKQFREIMKSDFGSDFVKERRKSALELFPFNIVFGITIEPNVSYIVFYEHPKELSYEEKYPYRDETYGSQPLLSHTQYRFIIITGKNWEYSFNLDEYRYEDLLDIDYKIETSKSLFTNKEIEVLRIPTRGYFPKMRLVRKPTGSNIVVNEEHKHLLNKLIEKIKTSFLNLKDFQKDIIEGKLTELNNSKSQVLKELDKDGNGQVDVIEGDDFNLLLKRHQKHITELGRNDNKNYIQQFIQLKNYLVDERKNIQHLFNLLNDVQNQELLDDYVNILNNNIHSYKVLLIHSLNMICVLIEDDLLTFYDTYERLDKLNVFNSNFQNQMLSRLSNIETRLDDVIYSIQDMSLEIVSSLDMLTDEIQQSSNMLSKNLESIESSIDVNTFITGIGVYQMYKMNKKLN